ncbi:MAG TPA: ABC transporter ATP-binding protein [Patescibacteria group bacterium]|jgi:lipopolysaccharide transport system ATP-binding protein|nr:ABC transporter ATP-binding protein [Patescibacteria group bacterium]
MKEEIPHNQLRVEVKNVTKTFKIPHESSTSIKQTLLNINKHGYELNKVLEDISFTVKQGEFFGIIGRNGSGKSTLLKLLAGIYDPTEGSVAVHGTLTPFIELGVGFNPELTGRENIFLNGAIFGLSDKEIAKKYQAIVDFAELHRFMDQKLKNYSSGMQVRLAFSIAIQAHNDILLVDEVLAVGDMNFQEKCFNTFEGIKASDKTVIFISHDLGSVERFCDRVAIIDKGQLVAVGPATEMVMRYATIMAEEATQVAATPPPEPQTVAEETVEEQMVSGRPGTGKIRTQKIEIINSDGQAVRSVAFEEPFTVRVSYKLNQPVERPVLGIAICDKDNRSLIGPNTKDAGIDLSNLQSEGYVDIKFEQTKLVPGVYFVTCGWFNSAGNKPHDYLDRAVEFKILGKARHGSFYIEPEWSVH